jgi:hypothetical protein
MKKFLNYLKYFIIKDSIYNQFINKESQCLECDGKGNNIRLSTFNKKLAAFKCNKCSNEWEAIKTVNLVNFTAFKKFLLFIF